MQKTYIQITSGRGPEECCRVVVLVMEKLIRQAKDRNIICKLIDYEPGLRDGCLFSATLQAEGDELSLKTLHRNGRGLCYGWRRKTPSVLFTEGKTGSWEYISSRLCRRSR